MSGSCQLKTCWKSAPDFHIVGRVLKHQFRKAILVDQSNLGNGEPVVVLKRARNKKSNGGNGGGGGVGGVGPNGDMTVADVSGLLEGRDTQRDGDTGERGTRQPNADKNAARMARKLETSLFYYQRSPNFCERDLGADIQGEYAQRERERAREK